MLGARTARPLPPRSTERAIVARMTIYSAALLTQTFPSGSTVDVEYERVGVGRDAKRRAGTKVSPDMIFHERSNPKSNFLVVEVKCRGHKRGRAWRGGPETGDLCKIGFFTNHLEQEEPEGMTSYAWGLCLELDSAGADQWWMTRRRAPMPWYQVDGVPPQGPAEAEVYFRRWPR